MDSSPSLIQSDLFDLFAVTTAIEDSAPSAISRAELAWARGGISA